MNPVMIALIILIVPFVLGILTAGKFSGIAKMKGHDGYFKWCFWLGPIGWFMVMSLPDRRR